MSKKIFRSASKIRVLCSLLPMVGLTVGCSSGEGGSPQDLAPDGVAQESQPIASEQLSGVADAVWRHYNDPEIAMSSYAAPALFAPGAGQVSCSAAMVGPNVMLTAGHCGGGPYTASFMLYPHANSTDKNFENFDCTILGMTWYSSDLSMYYCAPNTEGVNPGDKYGYFDFDTSPIVAGSTRVYSIWANPLDTPLPSQYDVRFYSQGVVTSTTELGTYTTDPSRVQLGSDGLPDFTTGGQRPIGIGTDLWCNGGASGSAQINAVTHRYLIGPLSQGTPDGRGRYALSMAQYLADGTFPPLAPDRVNTAELTALGIENPNSFVGLIDANHDGVLDIQAALEQRSGEAARDFYNLRFRSARQNNLFTNVPYTTTTFNTDNATAHLDHGWNGFTDDALRHDKLNLTAGATYRIALQYSTASINGSAATSSTSNVWVGLTWPGGETGNFFASNPTAGWVQTAETLTVPASVGPISLVVRSRDRMVADIASLNVIQEGSVMDFETYDKRFNWRNDINGARGLIVPFVPVGSSPIGMSPGIPNWVARVDWDSHLPSGFPMRNRQLGLDAAHNYQICFDYVTPPDSAVAAPVGAMRLVSGSTQVVSVPFVSSSSTWQHACSSTFRPVSGDNNMQFGFLGTRGSFMIDNIAINQM